MTLRDLLTSASAALPDATSETVGGTTTWRVDGRPFATLSADAATSEFALDPAVAAAAVRTPDAVLSPRGEGWVAFRPVEIDQQAVDRATAWFASAYRRVGAG